MKIVIEKIDNSLHVHAEDAKNSDVIRYTSVALGHYIANLNDTEGKRIPKEFALGIACEHAIEYMRDAIDNAYAGESEEDNV